MDAFEIFLLELAKILHFPTLAPDENGACLIMMKEGEIPLLFEFDQQLVPNTILLSSPLLPIPTTHCEKIYKTILIGNSSQEQTLSVKLDEEILYLHQRFHPSIRSSELEPLLNQFLEQVRVWKEKIETIIKSPPSSDETPPHPSAIQVFPYKA
jgi:hypothetical protein